MKKEKEQKLYWRRLDNSAKIFPISAGKKYSTVFRLSVVLKENVNPRVLEKALQNALETYQSFKVRMKAGLFWYYLEHNPKDPIIEEEKEYPCQYINPKTNNNYLFKVTYFEKKINIDIKNTKNCTILYFLLCIIVVHLQNLLQVQGSNLQDLHENMKT